MTVAVIAALVAFVGVLQVRSQAAVERSLEGQDNTSLAFLIDDLHQSNDELATEQAQLELRRQALQGGGSSAALNELNSEAQRLRMVEGLLPVHGAGVTIYIVAPLSGQGGALSLFMTHPPLEKRIARLEQMEAVHG